jgi:hypothetical protein
MKMISSTSSTDEGFKAYVTYLALKRHFTTKSYDFFKYNGKIKASVDTFRTRNDSYFFLKLARKDDFQNLILANMIEKPDIWVRDVLEQEGSTRYNNWKKKIDSLGYIFKSEINIMLDEYKDNFIVRDGQHPHIMTMLLQRKISLETFTIITHAANIFDYWDEKVVDKIVAGDIINKSRKYKPFLDIDMKRYKTFVKDRFM